MSAKHLYIVSFFGNSFKSLEDAKWNVKVSFTSHEALKYLKGKDEVISHYIGDRLCSQTPIYVDEVGNISFGRTRRLSL